MAVPGFAPPDVLSARPRDLGIRTIDAMTSKRQPSGAREPGAISLASKLEQFEEHWSPRTVTAFNGHDVMVVKVKGEFVWHHHDETDDFFMVLSGRLTIRLRDRDVNLEAGDLYVVPAGVEHQPYAEEEAHVLLIEPAGTPNTGDTATAAPRIEA
jgi:mannose-6-phosphate isomerase-like protein (cupin superfamily)